MSKVERAHEQNNPAGWLMQTRKLCRRNRTRLRRRILLGILAAGAWSALARAQNIDIYFPSGSYGYDQQLGVTVLTRARPQYDTPGIRLGGLVVHPNLSQGLFYNSNVTGTPPSESWGSLTSGSISANSDWVRNGLAAAVGFSHYQYFLLPAQDYTDWNVGLGGGYTIGDSQLQAAYSHQTYHYLGTAIGTVQSESPSQQQTDTAQVGYTINLSRFSVTPAISFSAYRFGNAVVLGQTVDQQFLNRNVLAGGVTTRYSLIDQSGLLMVVRGASSNYINPQPGQPSNNSNSFELLGGLDYQAKGVWRYRVLAGIEARAFEAAQYSTTVAPIVEGGVIWTPTGLTTVTGTISRAIESPQSSGTNGYIFTTARVVVDHEYMRNILLQGRGTIQYAQFLQSGGGSQTNFAIGARATWLVNRNVRLSLDYDFVQQTGSSNTANAFNPATVTSGAYTQNNISLTLHLAL